MGKKMEKRTNIDDLRLVRNETMKLKDKINLLSRTKQQLNLELINIQSSCNHDIVVRYKNKEIGYEARCLCCNKSFYGRVVGLDFYFNNIIDLQSLDTDDDKVMIAFQLFEQTVKENPHFSDRETVEIINSKIQKYILKQSKSVKVKKKIQI